MTGTTGTSAATNRGQTLLKGHALKAEGKPFDKSGKRMNYGGGYALCSCGLFSGWLNSDSARQRWHRSHKTLLRLRATR